MYNEEGGGWHAIGIGSSVIIEERASAAEGKKEKVTRVVDGREQCMDKGRRG